MDELEGTVVANYRIKWQERLGIGRFLDFVPWNVNCGLLVTVDKNEIQTEDVKILGRS